MEGVTSRFSSTQHGRIISIEGWILERRKKGMQTTKEKHLDVCFSVFGEREREREKVTS